MSNYKVMTNKQDDNIDTDCMICFYNVNIDENYIKCYNCNKLFHEKCLNSWKQKKNNKSLACIHCTKNDLILHKYETNCCVTCWNWSFPKKKKTEFKLILTAYH